MKTIRSSSLVTFMTTLRQKQILFFFSIMSHHSLIPNPISFELLVPTSQSFFPPHYKCTSMYKIIYAFI